jgi:hypothetical protein
MAIIREKGQAVNPDSIVVNQLMLVSVDRSMKDIGKFRTALRQAEAIFSPNRTALYDLYEDVLLDGHLTGIIGKRIDAVANKSLRFVKDDKEVEGMADFLESEVLSDIIKGLLESKIYGCTGFEFVPGENICVESIPRKHIKIEEGIISFYQSQSEGIEYGKHKLLWIIGKPRNFGLLLQCSVYAIYKKGTFADWAQYVEIFGQPVRIGKYDAADIKTKSELKAALDEAGSSLALMIPKQADFEIMDGKTSNANGELQDRLKDACNNEMSIVILGNTETTSNDNGGSNAKAKEHGKQQLEVTKSDMKFVLNKLNSQHFLNILKSYGLPVEGGKFKWDTEVDLSALQQRIIIDQTVANLVPVDDDHFYETYHVPKPTDYEVRRKEMDERKNANPFIEPIGKGNKTESPWKESKEEEKIKNTLSWMDRFRMNLVDFFDRAHKG